MIKIIIIICVMVSCSLGNLPILTTTDEVFEWVGNNLTYVSDGGSIFSEFRPYSDIISNMEGDCTQYAILSICMLKWTLDIDASLVAVVRNGDLHPLVRVNGELIDPNHYEINIPPPGEYYTIVLEIPNDVIMLWYGH